MQKDIWFNPGDLLCPGCRGELDKLNGFDGLLECPNGHKFPIWEGVAHLVPGSISRAQNETIDSFALKWKTDPEAMMEERTRIANDWFKRRFCFDNDHFLRGELRGRKRILDAGCGLGNLTKLHAELCCAEAEVWGIDLTPSVSHVPPHERLRVVRCDLRNIPIKGDFDWIISDGVLHHTDNTFRSLAALVSRLAPGGDILFYVYKQKAPVREFCDDLIREYFSTLTTDEAMVASGALTDLGRQLRQMNGTIEIKTPIPALGIEEGTWDLQRFIYWHFLKCFWDDGGNEVASTLENFDWYHPVLAHRHTEAEVYGWLEELDLDIIVFNEEPSGFAVRARRS